MLDEPVGAWQKTQPAIGIIQNDSHLDMKEHQKTNMRVTEKVTQKTYLKLYTNNLKFTI